MSIQNAFDQKKQAILNEIESVQPDLSPKGSIDELCLPIMGLINSHKDMVTTSSCSGRLSVFAEGTKVIKGITKVGGKGEGGKWLFVTHDQDKILNWFDGVNQGFKIKINEDQDVTKTLDGNSRYILYKYEPFILHVKCRDFVMASKLYNTAMSCGFRESGIGSNNLVGIRINIKLDVPIGYINETSGDYELFVGTKYIELLDRLSLVKFEENSRKIQELYDRIENEIINAKEITKETEHKESKEERRERKIKEGLERKRLAQEKKLRLLSLQEQEQEQ